jgi:hypothetical protein
MSGTLPSHWSTLSKLEKLYISASPVSGTLPREWSSLSNLENLGIDSTATNVSGTLPAQWSSLSNLRDLHINITAGNVSETLPTQWSSLSSLEHLFISAGNVLGTLPRDWSSLIKLKGLVIRNTNVSGALPEEWSSLSNLEYLSIEHTNASGTLPREWASMRSLGSLDLSCNNLSGQLPVEWWHMADKERINSNHHLEDINLSCQKGRGFSGGIPAHWRQFCKRSFVMLCDFSCLCHNNESLTASTSKRCQLPSNRIFGFLNTTGSVGDEVPVGLFSWQAFASLDWRDNFCVYPYAYQVVLALFIILPFVLVCMVAAGLILRRLQRQKDSGQQGSEGGQVPGYQLFMKACASILRPVTVVADILTDAVTIAEVWFSWVAVTLLVCVFIPELVTSVTLAVCMCKSYRGAMCAADRGAQKDLQIPPSSSEVDSCVSVTDVSINGAGRLARFTAWLASPLRKFEGLVIAFYGLYLCLAWHIVASMALVPVFLLWVPLLLLYAGLCKSLLLSAAPNQRGFKYLLPGNLYVLYDRCTGALEAPLTAALLVMLLMVGSRLWETRYVIKQPAFLYASLVFSCVHMLFFLWDMVYISTTSLSWREWWNRMNEPWKVAVAGQTAGCASGGPEAL